MNGSGAGGVPATGTGTRLTIDLGTSNTVAALSAGWGPPRVVGVDGAVALPSAVFAAEDGRLVVGREAERLARLAPARFEPNPKRRVDEGDLLLGDTVVPVAAALGAVLAKVVAEAVRQLGGARPDEVRLTHPAQWGAARRAVLLAAARHAGLGDRVLLVPEPVAAAAHLAAVTGQAQAPGQAIAVYDLGAGTFDVAIVAAGQQGFTVLAESGLSDLGGLDVDQALLAHLGTRVADADPQAWQRILEPRTVADRRVARALREDVRLAKEALSEHPQTEVALPDPFGTALVTRTELEELVEPGLRRSVELLGATARDAGLDAGLLAAVYLVGGASRIPLAAKLIAGELGVVPTALDQPETAVALGAHQVRSEALDPRTHRQPPWPSPGPSPGHMGFPATAPPPVRRGGRVVLAGLLSVLVVAAVVAVVVLAPWRSGSSSASGSPPAGAGGPNGRDGFHWSLTNADVGYVTGMWTTGDGVVLGTSTGLTAYDVATGEELWSWEVPEGSLCNMSPGTADGVGAVTYGPFEGGVDTCERLQTIALDSGEARWDEPVDLTADGYEGWLGQVGGTALSISDTIVTAAHAGRNAQSEHPTDLLWVDVRTGERLGETDAGAGPLLSYCTLSGFAQALRDHVVALAGCRGMPHPEVVSWSPETGEWTLDGDLENCPAHLSNVRLGGFLTSRGDTVLAGCGGGTTSLDGLYEFSLNPYVSYHPVDLTGAATDAMGVGNGGGGDPSGVLLTDRTLYLPRGTGGATDGVIAQELGGSSGGWQQALPGVSGLRLMTADESAVTVLVTTPGPAALHTLTGANRSARGPDLDPAVADVLPRTAQAARVGDYLVCVFDGYQADETAIGVVRAAP